MFWAVKINLQNERQINQVCVARGIPGLYLFLSGGGGVLNFELGTDVRPEVSTTTL